VISIIIPTLNEVGRLPVLLEVLRGEDVDHEIIVVDGGSHDRTADVARDMGVNVVRTDPGRGIQLRRGAQVATGDILLFLHADSRFPKGGLDRITECLSAAPRIVGGNFRLLFDGGDGFSRWLDGFYAWLRRHGFYYGDSGIFVRRDVYRQIGGVRPIPLMEDYDFVRRLENLGPTCCIDDPPLVTSSRRFEGRHPVRIVWGWLKIHLYFHLGISPDGLARLYDSDRRRDANLGCTANGSRPQVTERRRRSPAGCRSVR
jgi:rSAM/selenodomain-associated transferase 2